MKVSAYEKYLDWLWSFRENAAKRQWKQGYRTPKHIKHWN
jgi:hypothetical protein